MTSYSVLCYTGTLPGRRNRRRTEVRSVTESKGSFVPQRERGNDPRRRKPRQCTEPLDKNRRGRDTTSFLLNYFYDLSNFRTPYPSLSSRRSHPSDVGGSKVGSDSSCLHFCRPWTIKVPVARDPSTPSSLIIEIMGHDDQS